MCEKAIDPVGALICRASKPFSYCRSDPTLIPLSSSWRAVLEGLPLVHDTVALAVGANGQISRGIFPEKYLGGYEAPSLSYLSSIGPLIN